MTIVFPISKSKTLDKKKSSFKKAKLGFGGVKETVQGNPIKSMRSHIRDPGVSQQTVQRAIKIGGEGLQCPSSKHQGL
uniref:Uncharacterized protein n=1 Tax=Lepeophtheirus salmonis TaxID=72036 RepID=A0A0K2TGF4_LEPSM